MEDDTSDDPKDIILEIIGAFAKKEVEFAETIEDLERIEKFWKQYFGKLNKYFNVPDDKKDAAWAEFEAHLEKME